MVDKRMKAFISAVLQGDCDRSVRVAQELKESGVSSEKIVVNGLETAMSALDAKCTLEEFNLLEIMLAGRAVMAVMKLLYPSGVTTNTSKGTVVIATLEGDVTTWGKTSSKWY